MGGTFAHRDEEVSVQGELAQWVDWPAGWLVSERASTSQPNRVSFKAVWKTRVQQLHTHAAE
jgi:hypothetical protein